MKTEPLRIPLHCSMSLARDKKNSAFCMNWEIKCNWGSEGQSTWNIYNI